MLESENQSVNGEGKKESSEEESQLALLMQKAQSGDARSYERLLVSVRSIILPYLARRIRDQESVEDVLQEVLISIHRARHTYDPARPFFPWMYAIAKRRYIDYVRKWTRIFENEVQDETMNMVAAKSEKMVFLETEILEEAMKGLPAKQRDAIICMKFENLSVRETAEKLKMSESAVKVNAHRGYKALRKILEKMEYTH